MNDKGGSGETLTPTATWREVVERYSVIGKKSFTERVVRDWNRLPKKQWKILEVWMWHLGIWFGGEHGGARLTISFGPGGLFQPEQLYNSQRLVFNMPRT